MTAKCGDNKQAGTALHVGCNPSFSPSTQRPTTDTAGNNMHTKISKYPFTKAVTIAATTVIAAALLTGCAGLNGANDNAYAPVTAAAATAFQATRPSYTVNGRVCADATGSTSDTMPQFGPTIRGYVASAVKDWAHPAATDLTSGTTDQPGLRLQMRWVNTDPLADMNALNVSVPSVDALVAEPNVTSSTFVTDDQTWQTAATNIEVDTKTAVQQAAAAAASIKSFQWPNGNSGISACISALIQDLPAGHTALLVASDGEENEPPQVAGSLHGAQVLWVMPCPSGNAKHCTGLQASWKKLLTGLGAKSIKFVRPESATAAMFADFLKGA